MTTPLGLDLTTLLVLALDLDLIISINNTVKYIHKLDQALKLVFIHLRNVLVSLR